MIDEFKAIVALFSGVTLESWRCDAFNRKWDSYEAIGVIPLVFSYLSLFFSVILFLL